MNRTSIITVLAFLLVVGLPVNYAAAQGGLDPTNSPRPTMHTLEEIYQQLLATQQQVAALEARMEAAGIHAVPAGMELVPAGEFVMGDSFSEGSPLELPLHTNYISAFYMDKTEVTKGRWDEVYAWATNNSYSFENEGAGKATDHPVHTVNWYDCVKWANARSEMEDLPACYTVTGEVYRTGAKNALVCDWSASGYRLPTEAEWEKAARGGVASRRFAWSDTSRISHLRANYNAIGGYSYDDSDGVGRHPDYNSGGQPFTSPVASFAPNGYGLYDMTGNVVERCWDWYEHGYYTNSPSMNPRGPASGSTRMKRGGYWGTAAPDCRVTYRNHNVPSVGSQQLGFRTVRSAE